MLVGAIGSIGNLNTTWTTCRASLRLRIICDTCARVTHVISDVKCVKMAPNE